MSRTLTFRTRARLLVAGLALATTLSIALLVGSEMRRVGAAVQSEAALLASGATENLRLYFTELDANLSVLSDLLDMSDERACRDVLERTQLLFEEYRSLFVVDENGTTRCHSRPDIGPGGPPAFHRPWWEPAWIAEVATTGPMYGVISETWVVVHTKAIRDTTGAQIGVLGVSIQATSLESLLPDRVGAGGARVTILDRAGARVAASDAPLREDSTSIAINPGAPCSSAEVIWGETFPGWVVECGAPSGVPWIAVAAVDGSFSLAGFVGGLGPAILVMSLLVGVSAILSGRLLIDFDGAVGSLLAWAGVRESGESVSPPGSGVPEIDELSERFDRTLRARDAAREGEAEAQSRFRSMVQGASIGIYLAGEDGTILGSNPALARMLGYASADDLVGLNAYTLFATAEVAALLKAQLASGDLASEEAEWTRRDGTPFPVRLSMSRVASVAESPWTVIVDDLSDRRSLEEQLRHAQRMESVGRLAGGVAHDFNNLLTVISGHAELLQFEIEDADQRERIDEIAEAAAKSARLTSQLLTFSRKQVTRPEVLDLGEVTASMTSIIQRLMPEDVHVVHDIEPCSKIYVDRGQLEQILLNLCTNSRDAMPEGGTIHLRVRCANDGHWSELIVSDEGAGIPEAERELVFEPFFTTKPVGAGTGLGLSTVYGIVSQSEGEIQIDSAVGSGTTVTVRFPACDDGEEQAPSDIQEPGTVVEQPHLEILVIEDDPSVRALVVETLVRAGHGVTSSEDGTAARALAREGGRWDLAVSDVRMPGDNGPDVLRDLYRDGSVRGAVFVSGFPGDSLDTGWDGLPFPTGHLPKPFRATDLISAVSGVHDRLASDDGGGDSRPSRDRFSTGDGT